MNVINHALCESKVHNKNQSLKNGKNSKKIMAASVIGSGIGIIGAVCSIYNLKKFSNHNIKLKNLTYDEKDILILGAGSILGGLTGGLAVDKDKNNKIPKLREALLQFFGSLVCPIGILSGAERIIKKYDLNLFKPDNFNKSNNLISALPKIGLTLSSLVIGMNIGNKIMNKVNNKIFNQDEHRKVKTSDYLVHTDDICVAASLVFKDSASISAITSKILPASFILAGTKTGIQEHSS